MASFKPRHYTAVSLNLVWFFISLFFCQPGDLCPFVVYLCGAGPALGVPIRLGFAD